MNNSEINKYNMYKSVISLLKEFETIANSTKALAKAVSDFESVVAQIKSTDEEYQSSSAGIMLNKKKAEEDLLKKFLPIKSAVYAYALNNQDNELLSLTDVPDSSITRMRETEFIQQISSMLNVFLKNSHKFEDYGISADSLKMAKYSLDDFEEFVDNKDNNQNKKVAVRKEITDLFKKADSLLNDNIDNLLKLQKNDNPTFFTRYDKARTIKSLGNTRKTTEDSEVEEEVSEETTVND